MRIVRLAARGIGELLVTAGLLLLLFAAYQLLWTNLEADRAQQRVTDSVREQWRRPDLGSQPTDGTIRLTRADFGHGFAFLRIPRLGRDYSVPVVQGVQLADLARGVGHYPQTAVPGAVGNFAVAGHRATHGEPFALLDRVRVGDPLVVETRRTWFTYVVDRVRIVAPTDVWVLDPVPGRPEARPTRRLITLTTCNPRWASTQRLVLLGHLAGRQPTTEGRPQALAKGR